MLLKILQISECLKVCNFVSKKLQHCEIFKSACSKEAPASVYLKSKLKIMQFTHKPKTSNFRIYKVFSYLFSFANFSSTKFIFAFQSFSLKMYIVSAKIIIFYVCMFCFHICFAFMFAHMYAFIWYQTCTSSGYSKTEFHFKRSKNVWHVQ